MEFYLSKIAVNECVCHTHVEISLVNLINHNMRHASQPRLQLT